MPKASQPLTIELESKDKGKQSSSSVSGIQNYQANTPTPALATLSTAPPAAMQAQLSESSQGCWAAFWSCFSKAEKAVAPALQIGEEIGVNLLNALIASRIQNSSDISADAKAALIAASTSSITKLGSAALSGITNASNAIAVADGHVSNAIQNAGGISAIGQSVLAGVMDASASVAQVGVNIAADDVQTKAANLIKGMPLLNQDQKTAAIAAVGQSTGIAHQDALNAFKTVEAAAVAHTLGALNHADVVNAATSAIGQIVQPLASTGLVVGTQLAENQASSVLASGLSNPLLRDSLTKTIDKSVEVTAASLGSALGIATTTSSLSAAITESHPDAMASLGESFLLDGVDHIA